MITKIQQAILEPALAALSRFIDLPAKGAAVLDLSSADLDMSAQLTAMGYEVARLQSAGSGSEHTTLIPGRRDATGLDPDTVDMVVLMGPDAIQADRDTLFECAHILKPGGVMVLMHGGAVSLPGTVSSLTDSLSLQFNPFWQSDGPVRVETSLTKLAMCGFLGGQSHSLDTAHSFSRDDWVAYAAHMPAIADAGLSPAELKDFRLVLGDYIKRDFGPARFFVPFRAFTYLGFKAS